MNGRGMTIRTTAGAMTSLGLVMVMIALLVGVGATAAFAAQPLVEATVDCSDDTNTVLWSASSSDPSSDGGTADGAVTVIGEFQINGLDRRTTFGVGEFNDGNGWSMSGEFAPADHSNFFYRVIVEVDAFNDGSGVNSMVSTDWVWVNQCKNGTTSTTAPTTTTTAPVTIEAEVSASCVLENEVATWPITVTVTGDEGAMGTVSINGDATPYVIDADGTLEVNGNGTPGTNTVVVTDDVAGEILNEDLELADCTPTTTTEATTTTTQVTTTTDPGETTTTTKASSDGSSTDVSVLPEEIDQQDLPQTGLDNGPLAGIGFGFILIGAGLLVATRRDEGLTVG